MTDDRAVSDTIGFVLAFALVTATIAVTFATGVPALEAQQHAERVNNVERAFDVLADNVHDIQRHDDRSRATEVRLADGTLSIDDSTTITVAVYDESDGTIDQSRSERIRPRPLVFSDREDVEIVYEGGMVFRAEGGGSVALGEPRFAAAGDDRAVFSFVETYPHDDRTSIGGDDAVLVVAHRQSRSVETFELDDSDEEVRVTVESPRVDAWNRTLESHDGFEFVEADDGSVTYSLDSVESVTVSKAIVELELSE